MIYLCFRSFVYIFYACYCFLYTTTRTKIKLRFLFLCSFLFSNKFYILLHVKLIFIFVLIDEKSTLLFCMPIWIYSAFVSMVFHFPKKKTTFLNWNKSVFNSLHSIVSIFTLFMGIFILCVFYSVSFSVGYKRKKPEWYFDFMCRSFNDKMWHCCSLCGTNCWFLFSFALDFKLFQCLWFILFLFLNL